MPLSGGSTVVRSLLVRGMLAGLAAGLVAFVFAYVLGEPAVNGGIAFEEQLAAAHEHGEAGEALVSRGIQSTVGLLTGVLIYAVAIGGILALVYAATRGRFGPAQPRTAALVLAAMGFVAVILVPFLKYPGNPPASSDDGSIGQRTGLYLVMVLFSVLVAVLATALGRALVARLGTWNATLAAVGAYLLVVLIGGALLPVPSVDTWVQWRYDWAASPGSYALAVRATDGTGAVQPEARATPFPDGATGWHTITVTVG